MNQCNAHVLKILHVHYMNVRRGTKTFEIRVNDRAFQKGDIVVLNYFDPSSNDTRFSSVFPKLKGTIGDVYPIDAERVVFSLLDMKEIFPEPKLDSSIVKESVEFQHAEVEQVAKAQAEETERRA